MIGRTKPVIIRKEYPAKAKPDDGSWGCVMIPVVIAGSYFVLMSMVKTVDKTANRLEQLICYAALVAFIVIMILGMRDWLQENQATLRAKKAWLKGCTVAQVKIVDRHGGEWDDGYRFHSSWWLHLEMGPDQARVSPNATTLTAQVDQFVYARLEKRDTVRIYYRRETPLAFFIEDEL